MGDIYDGTFDTSGGGEDWVRPRQVEICTVCRHPKTKHLPPQLGSNVYWQCWHRLGHPWDGPCECGESSPSWVVGIPDE